MAKIKNVKNVKNRGENKKHKKRLLHLWKNLRTTSGIAIVLFLGGKVEKKTVKHNDVVMRIPRTNNRKLTVGCTQTVKSFTYSPKPLIHGPV